MPQVKSLLQSKIFWTQAIALVAYAATFWGISFNPEMQAIVIGVVQSTLTVIFKDTTTTVTPRAARMLSRSRESVWFDHKQK